MRGLEIPLIGCRTLQLTAQVFLFGVSAPDPLTFGAAAGVLLLVSAAAAYVPAWRAAGVDPMAALRSARRLKDVKLASR